MAKIKERNAIFDNDFQMSYAIEPVLNDFNPVKRDALINYSIRIPENWFQRLEEISRDLSTQQKRCIYVSDVIREGIYRHWSLPTPNTTKSTKRKRSKRGKAITEASD